MAGTFVDVSSWNEDSRSYFQHLKDNGAQAVVVKLTEGVTYRNPKALTQIKNARAVGMVVHGYHYARFTTEAGARKEAQFFVTVAREWGLGLDSVMVDDVEDPNQPERLTLAANAFADEVLKSYPRVAIYSMRSWFQDGHLVPAELKKQFFWVAEFQATMKSIGVPVAAWQYTNNFKSTRTDASLDYTGLFTGGGVRVPMTTSQVTWYPERGTFTLNQKINLRTEPISGKIISVLSPGQKVKYDAYAYLAGYVWIRQPRESGYGYLATGTANGTKRTSYWGSFGA